MAELEETSYLVHTWVDIIAVIPTVQYNILCEIDKDHSVCSLKFYLDQPHNYFFFRSGFKMESEGETLDMFRYLVEGVLLVCK